MSISAIRTTLVAVGATLAAFAVVGILVGVDALGTAPGWQSALLLAVGVVLTAFSGYLLFGAPKLCWWLANRFLKRVAGRSPIIAAAR